MKRIAVVGAAVALCVLLAATASARPPVEPKAGHLQELTEKTLLNGLDCENCGVRASAMYMLGDLKIEKAVIPLMALLKGAPQEQGRIIAALSLCKIGDARGVFAVKRAALFDSSERVRATCAWYYNEYVKAGTFKFGTPEPGVEEEIAQR